MEDVSGGRGVRRNIRASAGDRPTGYGWPGKPKRLAHFKGCSLFRIVLGVSTRGYERSLEPVPEELTSRGTSKSSASRALIGRPASPRAPT
jgi:hypothetical protein